MEARTATVQRETRETKVSVELCLDGTGQYSVNTGNGFFDHLLSQLARHSLIDLTIEALLATPKRPAGTTPSRTCPSPWAVR